MCVSVRLRKLQKVKEKISYFSQEKVLLVLIV